MPELPEVEVICRQLRSTIIGKKIKNIDVFLAKSFIAQRHEKEALNGARIISVRRRGKYILLYADNKMVLVVHLRMTGVLIYTKEEKQIDHLRVRISFTDGSNLFFKDVRTFGGINVLTEDGLNGYEPLLRLGKEPLGNDFDADYLYRISRKRKTPVKSLLLNQEIIAGIGNIYADEALFEAGIRPRKRASRITKKEAMRLTDAVKKVLIESISRGGTSFRDYRDSNGKRGRNVKYLNVYGRAGVPCFHCGAILKKIQVGGRTTVYCSNCQE